MCTSDQHLSSSPLWQVWDGPSPHCFHTHGACKYNDFLIHRVSGNVLRCVYCACSYRDDDENTLYRSALINIPSLPPLLSSVLLWPLEGFVTWTCCFGGICWNNWCWMFNIYHTMGLWVVGHVYSLCCFLVSAAFIYDNVALFWIKAHSRH